LKVRRICSESFASEEEKLSSEKEAEEEALKERF
jgi:hypothetical protein